jgi:hypothetical protein
MTDSVLEYKNLFKVKELMNEYLLSTWRPNTKHQVACW